MNTAAKVTRNVSADPLGFEVRGMGIPGGRHYRGLLVNPQPARDALLQAFEHGASARSLLDNLVEATANGGSVECHALRGVAMLVDHALALICAVNETAWKAAQTITNEAAP